METEERASKSFLVVAKGVLIIVALGAPLAAQTTQRISVTSSGEQSNGSSGGGPLSADGRYVAFASGGTNLVPRDTNGKTDVFVRDRQVGSTERISVSSTGAQANGRSGLYGLMMSSDARYVAFASEASNLVPGDANGKVDVFVRDRELGITECASVDPMGTPGNDRSGDYGFSMSADGRYVVFASWANLVPGDIPGLDVYVRDRQLSITERVSVDSSGSQANAGSFHPSISADGRYVTFASAASNLVIGDTNHKWDIFVRDRLLDTTELVSVDSSGAQADGDSLTPAVSADGHFVAFASDASNLVAGETNPSPDVFLHDRQSGTTERISVDSLGAQGFGTSQSPSISADGRYVAFYSDASTLVPGDTNGESDCFLRDRQLGTTERVSVSSSGTEGNDYSAVPWISADGRYIAFSSWATTLVEGDTNIEEDVLVRDRIGEPGFTSLCDPGIGGVIGCPCLNSSSGPGRGCDNSAGTGGAILTAAGGTFLSSDSLAFATTGETPTATSVLLQGTSSPTTGVVYGQGVRCVGGTLKRLFTKTASGGSIIAPNFSAGDPTVSGRSAAMGNPISAGQSRWYLVAYRDPIVLGGCPSASTFNATQTGQVSWSP